MSDWISVKERLPQPHSHVLAVTDKHEMAVVALCTMGVCDHWHVMPDCGTPNYLDEYDKVTHWQTLPVPPVK